MSKYEEKGTDALKRISEICRKEKICIGDIAFNILIQICSESEIKKLKGESKYHEFKFTMELK